MVKELGCQIVTQLIIDRYKHLQEDKLVFGKINYWSMCKKLKTVMTACGIEKAISYHCGRHSSSLRMGLNSFVTLHLFTDRLQFKRCSQHDRSAAEGVVVGVGVDAVEDGVGVVALVQEVIEFESVAKLNIRQLVNAILLAFVKEHREDLKNIRSG